MRSKLIVPMLIVYSIVTIATITLMLQDETDAEGYSAILMSKEECPGVKKIFDSLFDDKVISKYEFVFYISKEISDCRTRAVKSVLEETD